MNKSKAFPRKYVSAARMVQEYRGEYSSLWSAVESITAKLGCVPQTLWLRVLRLRSDRPNQLWGKLIHRARHGKPASPSNSRRWDG